LDKVLSCGACNINDEVNIISSRPNKFVFILCIINKRPRVSES